MKWSTRRKDNVELQGSYRKSATVNSFEFLSSSNTPTHTSEYELDDQGYISRIIIHDAQGILTHYAIVTYEQENSVGNFRTIGRDAIEIHHDAAGRSIRITANFKNKQTVKAVLVDMQGKIVRTFDEKVYKAGPQTILHNLANMSLCSGMYMYQIHLNCSTIIRTIHVIR